jgi:hypothetical protein
MKKRRLGIIRTCIKLCCFGLLLGPLLFPNPACAGGALSQAESPPSPANRESDDPQFLSEQANQAAEPAGREGAGFLILKAPGERYRLGFRLLARGPEALRLELMDPFGRPLFYLFSSQGRLRLFSISEKKEIPFGRMAAGPFGPLSDRQWPEVLKILWGRVPLIPFQTRETATVSEKGRRLIKISLRGEQRQDIWVQARPFQIARTRIQDPGSGEEVQITFSDFSNLAGNPVPFQIELEDGTGERGMSLRFESLIVRPDLSEEFLTWPGSDP